MIEARGSGQDHTTGAGDTQTVFEMDLGERSLPHHEHQFLAFLEHDFSAALHQIGRSACRDCSEGPGATGYDHHSIRRITSACDGGVKIENVIKADLVCFLAQELLRIEILGG